MSSLLLTIAAIAALCGPRVQSTHMNESAASRQLAKECQVQMIKCVKAKSEAIDNALAICMQEIK